MNEAIPQSSEIEGVKAEIVEHLNNAVADLFDRARNDPEVISSLRAFGEALSNRALYGDQTKDLPSEVAEKIADILKGAAIKIEFESVGLDPKKDEDAVRQWIQKFE